MDDKSNWVWSTGELWGYSAWNDGEPNCLDTEKNVILWPDKWNNLAGDNSEKPCGYVLEIENQESMPKDVLMLKVKTGEKGNVRSGPGKDYDLMVSVDEGYFIMGTGKTESNSYGNIWYEVYLDNFDDKKGYVYSGGVKEAEEQLSDQ